MVVLGIIGHSESEVAYKDHWSPTPDTVQNSPKSHTMYLTVLSKCFLSYVRLGVVTTSLESPFQFSTTSG